MVRRCRLTHQVDPGLKALGFQGFDQLKVHPFQSCGFRNVNLHPCSAAAESMGGTQVIVLGSHPAFSMRMDMLYALGDKVGGGAAEEGVQTDCICI